jgi:hypothetical protein
MIYLTKGKISVYNNWIVAYLSNEISEYYRSLLPKAWYVKPQKYKCHGTIVRVFEKPNKIKWDEYNNELIEVRYDSEIKSDNIYFWLDCWCDRINQIRVEQGLSEYRGDFKSHHFSIGNVK